MFAAGFLTRMAWDAAGIQEQPMEEQTPQEIAAEQKEETDPEAMGYVAPDTIRVRIQDNQVQWYDGKFWHEAASVEELRREDRFCLAEEAFREFDEQLRQEKAAERQAQEGTAGTLSAGVKETPKPVQRPQAPPAPQATPEPQAPADVPTPEPASPGSGAGGGGAAPENPAAPPPVTPPPADAPAGSESSGDTGDGENMEWSDDYL